MRTPSPDSFVTDLQELERRVKFLEQTQDLTARNIKVVDANGVTRVYLGTLKDGVSIGFEVDDATGNDLMDSQGLVKGITRIATTSSHAGGSIAGTAGPPGNGPLSSFGCSEITVASVNFTLARQGTVDVRGLVAGAVNWTGAIAPALIEEYIYVRISGQSLTNAIGCLNQSGSGGPVIAGTAYSYQVATLAAGTYTASLVWEPSNGVSDVFGWNAYSLDVFQLGS